MVETYRKNEDDAMPKRMLNGRLYSKTREGKRRMRWPERPEEDEGERMDREEEE
jgi:hypothetical protein